VRGSHLFSTTNISVEHRGTSLRFTNECNIPLLWINSPIHKHKIFLDKPGNDCLFMMMSYIPVA